MANLNTDLLSPEQAIEATVAAYSSKDALGKIGGLEASASEIDNSILFTDEYINSINQNMDYLETLVDGFTTPIQTTQVLDFSKDFTVSFVCKNLGVAEAYTENFFGVSSTTNDVCFGLARGTTYSNAIVYIKDNGITYFKTAVVTTLATTLNIVVSFNVTTKLLTMSVNGIIQNIFPFKLATPPTLPIALGKTNRNNAFYGAGIKMSDFVLFPFAFNVDDFKLADSFFKKKWNLDAFTVKDSWKYPNRLTIANIVNKKYLTDDYVNAQGIRYIQSRLASSIQTAVIGDSITHGSTSSNIKEKAYVNILKNYLNFLYGSKNFGFETISQNNGAWNATLFHVVSTSGTWVSSDATDIYGLNGAEKSGSVNAEMTFTITDLKNQKNFKVNYVQDISIPFTCEIYVNNILVGTDTITNSSTTKLPAIGSLYTLTDDGSNRATIKIKVISGPAIICGVTYYNNINDFILNSYAQSGRKTKDVKETVVSKVMKDNDVVFWNLGHNDASLTGVDLTSALQALDWVVKYAVAENTVVVFSDFLWTRALDNPIKLKLKDVAKALGNKGLYINIPSTLSEIGGVVSSSYLISDLLAWADSSHPNDKGHRLIFSQIKRGLQL